MLQWGKIALVMMRASLFWSVCVTPVLQTLFSQVLPSACQLTLVVIERAMNVSEREGTSWGKQQCSAVRGEERPGFFSLDLSSLVSAEPALWNVCSFVYLLSLQGWQLVGAAS